LGSASCPQIWGYSFVGPHTRRAEGEAAPLQLLSGPGSRWAIRDTEMSEPQGPASLPGGPLSMSSPALLRKGGSSWKPRGKEKEAMT
jgi:hypothetical protein